MSKLLTCFFFFQCLNLGFSQNEASKSKTIPEPILMNHYDEMTPFRGDYAVVYDGSKRKSCLINRQGKEVTGFFYSVDIPKNGLIKVYNYAPFEEESSIIDLSGKVIVPFGKYKCEIADDYIVASNESKKQFKVFDFKGRSVLASDKLITPIRKNSFLLSKDSTHQIVNEKGKVLAQTIAPVLRLLNARYFAFKKGETWGIMNDKFKEIISPKYDGIIPLPNSWIGLNAESKQTVLDANLSEVIPLGAYEEIAFTDNRGIYLISDGLIPVKKGGYWGYINSKNQLVIDFWFKHPAAFYNCYALQNRGEILIDKEGRIVQYYPFRLNVHSALSGNLILAEIDKTWCYIDYEGNVLLKCKPREKNTEEWPERPSIPPPPPPVEEQPIQWQKMQQSVLPPPPVEELRQIPEEPAMPEPKVEEILPKVEQPAEYIGGEAALAKFLSSNLKYPQEAKKVGISGVTFVKFKVKADGTLENPTIIKHQSLGYGCDEEAIRLIRAMPKWKPAKNQGKPVDSYYELSISFNL
jgi:TonB family protein